jgi:hypothetical protein
MPFTDEQIGDRFDKEAFANVFSIKKIRRWNQEAYLALCQQIANLPVSYGTIVEAAIRSQENVLVTETGDDSFLQYNTSMLPDFIRACVDREIKPLDPEQSARAYMKKYDDVLLRMEALVDPLKAHVKALQTEIVDADTSKISVLNLEKQRVLSSAADIRNPFKRWAYKRREMKMVKKMVDEDFSRIKDEKWKMISKYQTIIDKYNRVRSEGCCDSNLKKEFAEFAECYGYADLSPYARSESTQKTQMDLTSHMPESKQTVPQERVKSHDAPIRNISDSTTVENIVP